MGELDEEREPLLHPQRRHELEEQDPTLDSGEETEVDKPTASASTVYAVIPILLLGVFVSNADSSLVVATSGHIASEYNALPNASWLVTSFTLAQCAVQPLYGKLSDIFGRKINLVVSHSLFIIGCFLCGIGKEYWHVIAGRAISGLGAAGMMALVSIIITDLLPVRSVATWRSYVNVIATMGRSLGGPVGGWLTDTVGWRWSFYGQCFPTLLGLLLVLWRLPSSVGVAPASGFDSGDESRDENNKNLPGIRRVDFIGAVTLAALISSFLLTLDFVAAGMFWAYIVVPLVVFLLLSFAFYLIETRWAKEPILPMDLLKNRDVWTVYLIAALQTGAQFSIFYSIPIYFQIVAHMSITAAGSRLVPAVIGNAIGGLASGYIIHKTGRYKFLTTFASVFASIGYTLLVIRWHGSTNFAELLYIVPGGFGAGTIQQTTFIHLAASLDQSEIAIAGTSLFLSVNLGVLVGVSLSTSLVHAKLRFNLENDLVGVSNKAEIINKAMSSIDYIWTLPEHLRKVIVDGYIDGLLYAYGIAVFLAVLAILVGLTIRERRL